MVKLLKDWDREAEFNESVSLKEREYVDDKYVLNSKESMNMEDDLRGIYVDDSLDILEDELSTQGFEYYDEGQCIEPKDCGYRIWVNGTFKVTIYYGLDDNIVFNIYVKEKDHMMEGVVSTKTRHRKLRKEDINENSTKIASKESLVKESPMDYLDTTTRDVIDKMEQLGYTGSGKPIMFDGKPMGYWSKTYFTDKKTSSGIEVYIDPFDGSVEVQEFEYEVDTEDLTDICPVKTVRNSNDVLKIDRWAKAAKKHSYSLNYESIGHDRYDPNVEARFMDYSDRYSDMPDLYDLYAANKGLPVSEFIKDARNGGFSKAEIDAFIRDNGITGKMCEGCGKKKKKGTRKLKEGSNFDNVTDAIDYYYGEWLYGNISYNGIADELAGLGHSERFIDSVLDGITQLYDDQERYDYEHDYYDESVNRSIKESYGDNTLYCVVGFNDNKMQSTNFGNATLVAFDNLTNAEDFESLIYDYTKNAEWDDELDSEYFDVTGGYVDDGDDYLSEYRCVGCYTVPVHDILNARNYDPNIIPGKEVVILNQKDLYDQSTIILCNIPDRFYR